MNEKDEYIDMYNLKHFEPLNHSRMPISERAAQFLPFAALTGLEESIINAGKEKTTKIELDDSQKEIVNSKLQMLIENNEYEVIIEYFVNDEDNLGHYEIVNDYIKKVDVVKHIIFLKSGIKLSIDNILSINSPLFNYFE